MKALNRSTIRPGHQPRRHSRTSNLAAFFDHAQRRRFGLQSAHLEGPAVDVISRSTEGRDISTRRPVGFESRTLIDIAQRRPGHQPRRHREPGEDPLCRLARRRSTKAGTSAPATPASSTRRMVYGARSSAQRRPGHQPRRHRLADGVRYDSTRTLNEGRDISPGDTFTSTSGPPEGRESFRRVAQRRPGHQPRRHA